VHFRLLFQDEYLAAPDLHGRDVTVTIARVQIETLVREDGKEDRPVVHFEEMRARAKKDQRRWVLNKTNARTIAKMYGTDADGWVGKRITLYPTTCKAFGDMHECIRVRPKRPPAKPQREPKNDPPPETERQPGDDEHDPRDKDAP
jgi:hypothetical protein